MNKGTSRASVELAFFVVLLLSFIVMSMLPALDLPQACVQEAALAVVAIAGVGIAVPGVFERCTTDVQQRESLRFVAGALLLIGLVGGAISLFTWGFPYVGTADGLRSVPLPTAGDAVRNFALLLGICAFTGAYEEAFTRVLGIGAIERALDTKRAVVLSAALFALLHVGVPDLGTGPAVLVQVALKFAQSLLFGVILGVLYARTRRLWPCALLHAGFDVLYLAPQVIIAGALPATYASGAARDTVLLAVTVALLAAVAVAQVRAASRHSGGDAGGDGSGDGGAGADGSEPEVPARMIEMAGATLAAGMAD